LKGSPLLEARNVAMTFGAVVALDGVSLSVAAGEVHCLLGDNGAGKSTLIKILSGVHRPTSGELYIEGERTTLQSPRDAQQRGIATVFQDLGMIPLISVARNFFLGREPVRKLGPFGVFDQRRAEEIAQEEMAKFGIAISDAGQPVGTLSGGERQCVAIARAVYFGAKVLILDEPTSALGVNQTALVVKCIDTVRSSGLGVIFITHNVKHAIEAGDRFTVLNRGRTFASKGSAEIAHEELHDLMSGVARN
jgi:simple sugar transport system ATP-binding protein